LSAPRFITALLLISLLAVATASAQRPGYGEGRDRAQGPRSEWHHQGGAGSWLRRHQDLPPAEQQRALERDPAFQHLPPERQQALRQHLDHFNSLPPEQRQRVLQRMETWARLTPAQKDRARNVFSQYRNLPEDRRQALNRAYRNLHDMAPQDRQRAIDSPAYRNTFTDQERDILHGMADLNVGPPPNVPRPENRPPAYVPRPPGSN
jgi:hypothetical protein